MDNNTGGWPRYVVDLSDPPYPRFKEVERADPNGRSLQQVKDEVLEHFRHQKEFAERQMRLVRQVTTKHFKPGEPEHEMVRKNPPEFIEGWR